MPEKVSRVDILTREKIFEARRQEIIESLKSETDPLRQAELGLQRVVIRHALGKGIRTEEDFVNELNSFVDRVEGDPNVRVYFAQVVRQGQTTDIKGRVIPFRIPRSRAIIEDTRAGRFSLDF